MTPRIVKGSKREIAETVARLDGEVSEAIVFMNDPAEFAPPGASNGVPKDIFAEMDAFTVRRGDSDDSRDALYRRGVTE